MSDARHTATLAGLAAATLGAALFGHGHGSPDPAVMLVVMMVAVVAGIAGIAFSALSSTVLLHLMDDPMHVLQLVAACSVVNQILTVWSMRQDIVWREIGDFAAGGLAGIGPGLWALLHVEPRLAMRGVGAVLLAYAGHLLVGRLPTLHVRSRWADAAVGFAASSTGVISTLPSLPVTVWCQARGLDKNGLRATVQPFVLVMQLVTLPLLARAAPESAIGWPDLLCLPGSLFGTQIALNCVRGLSERQFAVAVAALLIVCGVSFWL